MPLTNQEKELFARARDYIATDRLPRTVPRSVFAGSGKGATCSLCETTIEPEQVESEFSGDDGITYRLHMGCHAIWELAATSIGSTAQAVQTVVSQR